MNRETDNLFNKIQEAIGSEKLAEEMYRAMSTDQANDILKFIAKNYEIEQ